MNEQQEKRISRVQQNTKLGLEQRMAEREDAIITRLVTAYVSGKLNSEQLFGGIAAIAELRSIVNEARHDYLKAEAAVQHITGVNHA